MRRITRLNVLFIVCNGALLVAEITSPCKLYAPVLKLACSFWSLARNLLASHYFTQPAGVSDAEPLLDPYGQLDVASKRRENC